MNLKSGSAWLGLGLAVGVLGGWLLFGQQKAADAGNDRFEDYVMSTGRESASPPGTMDGVWMIDYQSGKLLGTVVDRRPGKVAAGPRSTCVTEFGLQPKQNVHFLVTNGTIAQGGKPPSTSPRPAPASSASTR